MLKRHLRQQRAVEEYGRNIKQLAGRAQGLLAAGHPEGCVHQLGVRPGLPPTPPPGSLQIQWENRNRFPGKCEFEKRAFWSADWPSSIPCLGSVWVASNRAD